MGKSYFIEVDYTGDSVFAGTIYADEDLCFLVSNDRIFTEEFSRIAYRFNVK
jgi:hypothetical protein